MNVGSIVDSIVEIVKKEIGGCSRVIAKVVTAPPNITLEYSGLKIPTEQIRVSNHLLPQYHRQYKFVGDIIKMKQDSTVDIKFNSGETTMTDHKHGLVSGSGSGTIESTGTYEFTGDLWLTDTLQAGNEVLVEIVDGIWIVTNHISNTNKQAEEGA